MMLNILVLGFMLSLDNFRTSIALGPLRLRWRRAAQVALVFGLFDGAAPLVGILFGHYISQKIGGPVADFAGPIVLGAYGLYLVVQAWQDAAPADPDCRWSLFGLPIPLSLDNVIAGTGLGLTGLSPLVPALLFGVITALMSFIGLQLGRLASYLIPIRIRWDLVAGAGLIIEATLLGLGVVQ
jgi:putative Mn2+ efflux pump MntP